MAELGGDLTVSSAPGRGTSFTARFPTTTLRKTVMTDATTQILPTFARGRVLVVDDERMIVSLVQNLLEGEQDVLGTTSPEEALALIAREHFDVILCDVMMPNTNGLEFFRAAVRVVPEMAPRFVFMTGAASSESLRDALREAGNPIVDKPFDARKLREVVRDAVRRKERPQHALLEGSLSSGSAPPRTLARH
jgi:CheY-like chemotaxis protein